MFIVAALVAALLALLLNL